MCSTLYCMELNIRYRKINDNYFVISENFLDNVALGVTSEELVLG